MKPTVFARIPLPDPELVAEAATYPMADLHEALGPVQGRMALMSPRMRPLFEGTRICGPAVTSWSFPGDNLMIHAALQMAQRGQVLVLTSGGAAQGALWGDLAGTVAVKKGLAGVVADGGVRDTDTVRAMGLPVWSTAVWASHPEKRAPGSVNVPIVVDGVLVEPGDVVVGDGDGVLVIPRAELGRTVEGARARVARDADFRRRMDSGETLFDILDIPACLRVAGVPQHDRSWLDPEPSVE